MKKSILLLGSAMLLIAAPSFSQEQSKSQPEFQKKETETVKSKTSIQKTQAIQPMKSNVVRKESVKSVKATRLQEAKATPRKEEEKTSK